MTMKWILREDGALCLEGYPIRIVRGTDTPFVLISDWHKTRTPAMVLGYLKREAERLVAEIREFTPAEEQ